MKVIWEERDVKVGMQVRRPGSSEIWIIGYDPSTPSPAKTALAIVSLNDGMICRKDMTPAEAAAFLNEAGNQPIVLTDAH